MKEYLVLVVGLGPGGAEGVPQASLDAMRAASCVLLRTSRHPGIAELLSKHSIVFQTADDLYESSLGFAQLYRAIAERVIALAKQHRNVVYAVPGHPLFGERSVSELFALADAEGLHVQIIGATDFVAAALEATRYSFDGHLMVLNAYDLNSIRPDPRAVTLVYQVDSVDLAADTKLALMNFFPDEHLVTVVAFGRAPLTVPLYELDRQQFTHLTSVLIPPLQLQRTPGFYGLVEIVAALRGEGGCPWDRAQTHETLKTHLVEETYEVLSAIDSGDPQKLCDELGDFLLQALMHAQIDSEQGFYDIEDVIRSQSEKLLRRHPHVFGGLEVESVQDVLHNWDRIKLEERQEESRSALAGVPKSLPALLRAYELSKRAARLGFDWPELALVLDKIEEEIEEVRAALSGASQEQLAEEFGDLLFAVANAARMAGLEPEDCLRKMLDRFTQRFQWMEARLVAEGRDPKGLSLEEWERLWSQAKEQSG